MKIRGLDGRDHNWNFVGTSGKAHDTRPRSKLHLAVRELIQEEYPGERVYEEVFLPGAGTLYADFYLSQSKIMVECQGEQHSKFVPHFHGTRLNFIRTQKRDKDKRNWCDLNNITLIELYNTESIDEWRAKF